MNNINIAILPAHELRTNSQVVGTAYYSKTFMGYRSFFSRQQVVICIHHLKYLFSYSYLPSFFIFNLNCAEVFQPDKHQVFQLSQLQLLLALGSVHKSGPPRKKSPKETKRGPHFSEKGDQKGTEVG